MESVDEILECYEDHWQEELAPDLSHFIESLDESDIQLDPCERRLLIEELVKVDLEYRWKWSASDTPPAQQTNAETVRLRVGVSPVSLPCRPLLEDYLQCLQELGTLADLSEDLILEEYRVRNRWGDRPDHEQFCRRFEDRSQSLKTSLIEADRQLAFEAKSKGQRQHQPEAVFAQTQLVQPAPSSRYRKTKLFAEGGLGKIWLAGDTNLQREVALKEIRADRARIAEAKQRFLNEARITGQLEHPNIVPVYELADGNEDQQPFYTMRLVRGRTFEEAIRDFHQAQQDRRIAPLELSRLLSAFNGVCNAIAYAHSRGVLHRDLKPSNVVLGDFGEVIVLDWGLAKLFNSDETAECDVAVPADTATVTVDGALVGTPAYMSPEQAAGDVERIGTATDVYGLGAILYQILCGERPHQGDDTAALLSEIVRGNVKSPREVNPRTPAALDAICVKAMEKDPDKRYSTAQQLADDVQRWTVEEPVSVHRESIGEKVARWTRRHRAWAQSAAAATLLITLLSVVSTVLIGQQKAAAEQERENAVEQQRVAESEKDKAQRLAAELLLEKGITLARQGRPDDGVLWMARAREQLPENSAQLDRFIRTNLSAWGSNLFSEQLVVNHDKSAHRLAVSPDGKIATGGYSNFVDVWDAGGRRLDTRLNHGSEVDEILFTQDGKHLLTISTEAVHRWDAATGRPVEQPAAEQRKGKYLAVSRDGNLAALLVDDKTVELWNLLTGKVQGKQLVHHEKVELAENVPGRHVFTKPFSPDDRFLLTRTSDNHLHIWDSQTGKRYGRALEQEWTAWEFVWVGGGAGLITSEQFALNYWDLATGERLSTIYHGTNVQDLVVNKDGSMIAASLRNGMTRLWKMHDWNTHVWHPFGSPIQHQPSVDEQTRICLAFSPDQQILATASSDGTARLWDVQTTNPLGAVMQHRGMLTALAFAKNGQALVTSGLDGTARTWSIRSTPRFDLGGTIKRAAFDGEEVVTGWYRYSRRFGLARWQTDSGQPANIRVMHEGESGIYDMQLDSEAKTLVAAIQTKKESGDYSSSLRAWDARTGRFYGKTNEIDEFFDLLTFTRDGKSIAFRNDEKKVYVWRAIQAEMAGPPLQHVAKVVALAVNRDASRVVTAADDKQIRVWDVASGQVIGQPFETRSEILTLDMNGQGELIAVAGKDGSVQFIHNSTRRPVGPTISVPGVNHVKFGPTGKTLVTVRRGGSVEVWDVSSREPIGLPMDHPTDVSSIAFSPDGKLLATGTKGHYAYLWDVASGRQIGPALRHRGNIDATVFSNNGKRLITVSGNEYSARGPGDARLWNVPQPLKVDAGQIMLWAEVTTGTILNDRGVVQELNAEARQKKRRNLEKARSRELNVPGGTPQQSGRTDEPTETDERNSPSSDNTSSTPIRSGGDRLSKQIAAEPLGLKMALVPQGEFLMGLAESNLPWEKPRPVTIETSFYLGVFEVTQDEYRRVMGENPSAYRMDNLPDGYSPGLFGTENDTKRFPVESVNWYDAILFCNKLSELAGLKPYYTISNVETHLGRIWQADVRIRGGRGYRLPTEEEWEYACRAGTNSIFSTGDQLTVRQANIEAAAEKEEKGVGRPTTVGSYPPNGFGLFDMHGNVKEWCFSQWTINGTVASDARVVRGGGFRSVREDAASGRREPRLPYADTESLGDGMYLEGRFLENIGFRIARDP